MSIVRVQHVVKLYRLILEHTGAHFVLFTKLEDSLALK